MKAKQYLIDACASLAQGKAWDKADNVKTLIADAAVSVGSFLARQLTRIKSTSVDVEYPDLKGKELFPVSHEYPAGTESISVPSWDGKAIVKLINYYSTDLPLAEIAVDEDIFKVNNYGNAYDYSRREIRQSQLAGGKPLQQRKADAAHRAHEENINKLAFAGDGKRIKGVFNYPGIPKANAPQTFANSTVDEVLAIMNAAVTDIEDTTLDKHSPNVIALPIVQFRQISTTYRADASDKTILDLFKDANPGIEVMKVNEMKGAGTGGVDVMLVYERSPEVVQLQIPMEATHYAPQEKGMGFMVPIESECGGLNVYRPLAMNIVETI